MRGSYGEMQRMMERNVFELRNDCKLSVNGIVTDCFRITGTLQNDCKLGVIYKEECVVSAAIPQ